MTLSTTVDRSFAFIGVINQSKNIWCQTGLVGLRDPDGYKDWLTYVEVVGLETGQRQYAAAPSLNSATRLSIQLDASTGTWRFYKDLDLLYQISDTSWIGESGDQLDIAGEILHHETDMFGYEGSPLKVQNPEWKDVGGTWYMPNLLSYGRFSQDSTEWWFDTLLSENAFQLYDRNPMP